MNTIERFCFDVEAIIPEFVLGKNTHFSFIQLEDVGPGELQMNCRWTVLNRFLLDVVFNNVWKLQLGSADNRSISEVFAVEQCAETPSQPLDRGRFCIHSVSDDWRWYFEELRLVSVHQKVTVSPLIR